MQWTITWGEVKITPSNVNDSIMLQPLLDNSTGRFNLAEISADKAYLSDNNLNLINNIGGMPFIPFKVNNLSKRGIRQSGSEIWSKMYHMFMFNREVFMKHYHRRSNVETTFAIIKAKFGDYIRSKGDIAQVNELLLKILCHNICVLIQAIYELKLVLSCINQRKISSIVLDERCV